MPEDAVVLVGQKPTMNYVLATTMPLNEGRTVILKARGRAISKAVDIAEITRRRFFKEASIRSINIETEEIKSSMDGRPRNVSTIEITVAPTKAPAERKAKKPASKPSEEATE